MVATTMEPSTEASLGPGCSSRQAVVESGLVGTLFEPESGQRVVLPSHVTVGRDPRCTLCIGDHQVSQHHCSLHWTGTYWELRDLNSANGTWVNGKRCGAEPVILGQGDELAFWKDGTIWELVSAEPPVAMAFRMDGGGVRIAENGFLALPDGDNPDVVVWQDERASWVGERDGAPLLPRDGEIVVTHGAFWQLALPFPHITTLRPDGRSLSVENIGLRFHVSRNEEFVQVEITGVDSPPEIRPRACLYVLLLLARIRLEDIAAGYAESECGWVGSERLADLLKYDAGRVNVDIYRVRDYFGSLGVKNAHGLIERRSVVRELRIGVQNIEVCSLS